MIISQLYLTLCETQSGIRYWVMTDEPLLSSDRSVHFGPIKCEVDYWSEMDAAHMLANQNDFSLEDEETWPLEE